eukprot:CAMPEP_0116895480 /NCGR_PEP_ID=MMETSP0467-20121206/4988_1 /TAXON_ID=283647 /ORGANISM="Mesodinium pulex, Strain SPMC105" /LENGTH=82 /DNA_ID=CAMNT_0004566221 /DNA_START=32 /DNA_END=280 /DNA_ORIENTATION=+
MSSPLLRALAPAKIGQYAREAFVRQHNDLRNHPRGVQRLMFKIMFGAQFIYYWVNYGTWQKHVINKKRDIQHDALRKAHMIH